MQPLVNYPFSNRDRKGRHTDFRVRIDLEGDDIMDDAASFEIAAAMRSEGDDRWTEVRLQVEIRWSATGDGIAIFKHHGEVIRTIPIRLPKLGGRDADQELVDVGADDALLDESLAAGGLEETILAVPVPLDPMLGCLLNGAASTVIGQTIRCWNAHRQQHQGRELAKAIIGCLRESERRMTWTLIKRVAKCLITLGLW